MAADDSSNCGINRGCKDGVLFGQFDIQTRKANGQVQRLSQSGVGTRFSVPKNQLGSGYNCGFQAWSGHKIDAFGLIFLRKFTYGYWDEPKASLMMQRWSQITSRAVSSAPPLATKPAPMLCPTSLDFKAQSPHRPQYLILGQDLRRSVLAWR